MTAGAFFLLFLVHALALISPGPDFAVISRLSIVSGRGAGVAAAGGVACAIGLYVLFCLFGLSLLLDALPTLSRLLSVAGSLYLGYLGIRCLISNGTLPEENTRPPRGKAFLAGFMTNLLNPKAMAYFGSILSQVLTPEASPADALLVFMLLVTESFLWFALVAWLFSSTGIHGWLAQRMRWLDRLVGTALLGVALGMIFMATR
ncbi:LysE family translocator [Tepidiphilus olei]|uniref:LysE family translocator n=1 Tax=Tepidiphilus olei TaxID=2502184 RepID=UPI00115CB3C9|nr:LysE family transporter [Tepidiphilus olei]